MVAPGSIKLDRSVAAGSGIEAPVAEDGAYRFWAEKSDHPVWVVSAGSGAGWGVGDVVGEEKGLKSVAGDNGASWFVEVASVGTDVGDELNIEDVSAAGVGCGWATVGGGGVWLKVGYEVGSGMAGAGVGEKAGGSMAAGV